MSELRDLTAAMQAFSNSLSSVEACLAEMVAHSTQQRLSLHGLRSQLQGWDLQQDERDRAVQQVQQFCGAMTHKLSELHDTVTNLGATRLSDVRALSERVRQLEAEEEKTQP